MPSVTFKPVVLPHHRREDGTYPVKIRVTFKGVSRYVATNRVAERRDLTRDLRLKEGPLLDACRALAAQMRAALSDVSPFAMEALDADGVMSLIRASMSGSQEFRLDLFEFADGWLKGKKASTGLRYAAALNALERYLGERRIDVNAVTRRMVISFVEWVNAHPATGRRNGGSQPARRRGPGSSGLLHARYLSTIYDAARRKYNDEDAGAIPIPRRPFSDLGLASPSHEGQSSLGVEAMQALISERAAVGPERAALDAFVVSFCLMGANLADLWDAEAPRGGVWVYRRRKTESRSGRASEMRVEVPSEAGPYLARLGGRGGRWLPGLRSLAREKNACTSAINRRLKAWARGHDLPEFTFYAARHTWATLARKAGVDKATIDECLAHVGSLRTADIYIEKDWDVINAANRKVLALFAWPEG